jgi:hypothetical protein
MPIAIPTENHKLCHGFVMAEQDKSKRAKNGTSLDVKPCPDSACIPIIISESCKRKSGGSCKKALYCPRHHCHQCKMASARVKKQPFGIDKNEIVDSPIEV